MFSSQAGDFSQKDSPRRTSTACRQGGPANAGSRQPSFCTRHATRGDLDVVSRRHRSRLSLLQGRAPNSGNPTFPTTWRGRERDGAALHFRKRSCRGARAFEGVLSRCSVNWPRGLTRTNHGFRRPTRQTRTAAPRGAAPISPIHASLCRPNPLRVSTPPIPAAGKRPR